MARALASHLTWAPNEAAGAGAAVYAIEESEGLAVILEAIEQRISDLTTQLVTRSPSDDSAAAYERLIGQIQGLKEVPLIVKGVIENGRKAEQTLNQEE